MPGNKDQKERHVIIKKSKERIYEKQLSLSIRKDQNLWKPLETAASDRDMTVQKFILLAIEKELRDSGYIKE